MFDNEVNKLFVFQLCNYRASRKGFSHHDIASSLCLNSAPSSLGAAYSYAAITEFFPAATDFCSLNISAFIAPSVSNYSPTLI
jgi:hypothetical protein